MRWLLLLFAACNSGPVLTACPPAPLRRDGGLACDFPALPECMYAPPTNVGTSAEDTCNGLTCECCPHAYPSDLCTSTDHELSCGGTLIGCTQKVPVCPADAGDGASCAQKDNGECLVLGPGADLSLGIVNGEACACDFPGPIWRCVPAATTKPQ